jgi:hypothetical protein
VGRASGKKQYRSDDRGEPQDIYFYCMDSPAFLDMIHTRTPIIGILFFIGRSLAVDEHFLKSKPGGKAPYNLAGINEFTGKKFPNR